MRAVIERIEYSWWNMHIRILDESDLLRVVLPRIKTLWDRRDEATPYLVLSLIGFPIGVLIGLVTIYFF